ncbi:MAG: glycosyltransferase family 4 protein [bacterium]
MFLNNIKIAIITSSYPPYSGGVSSAHANLYHSFKDAGYNVKLFVLDKNIAKINNPDIIFKSYPKYLTLIVHYLILLYYWITDIKISYSQTADIVRYAIPSFRIRKPLKEFKPDYVIFPDHGAPGLYIKKILDCKFIWISHHNPSRFANIADGIPYSKKDISTAMKLENTALKKFDVAVCPSNYMKEVFLNSYTVIPKEIVVIPNLINQDLIHNIKKCDFPDEFKTNDNAILIYIPSAGSIFKGSAYIKQIILKLAQSTDRKLIFYLSGHIESGLKSQLGDLPANAKCFMPGHVSQEKNISYVKNCGFLISPTVIESFGLAILEGLYCGLPAIAFNVGGVPDLIVNNINGYLSPAGDIVQLVNNAQTLFDDKLRKEMSLNALNFANDNFGSKVVLDKYVEFLNLNI